MKASRDWSESERLALEGPRVGAHLLLAAVVAFVVCGLAWAHWATLDEVTSGQGKVIPSRHVQVVQNIDGGIVREILVAEGDRVTEGQVLLRIDDTRYASTFEEGRLQYLELTARVARLRAEVDGTDFVPPKEVSERQPQLVAGERALFESRKREYASALAILDQQTTQRRQALRELENRQGKLRRSLELARRELKITRPLAERGVISEVELLRLEREVNDLDGELGSTLLNIEGAQAALGEVGRKVEEYKASYRGEALADLNALQGELDRAQALNRGSEDRVTRATVRSPVTGIVKTLRVKTLGGVVQPGEGIVEIVPEEESLLVEAHIRPKDIAFLHPGQRAMVKFTAYDFSIYGGLEGKLEQISADTLVDEQGESFYRIRVRTVRARFGTDEEPLPIIPGMTTTVDILTGHKTVLDYLLKPILRAHREALRER
ncbi:HlyD family type I secretion periplasmic adaptor subunit [Endothiovibrio diazotrophicus]